MIHYAICWSSLCSSILIIWTCSQIFQIDCAHKQLHHLITCHCFSIKSARICEGWTKLFSKLHWQITFVCTKFGQYTAENASVIANYKLSQISARERQASKLHKDMWDWQDTGHDWSAESFPCSPHVECSLSLAWRVHFFLQCTVIDFVFFPSNNLEHVLCSTMFWQQSFFQILLNTQPKRIIWLWVQTVSFLSVTEFQKVGFEIPKPVLSAVR